jgi:uncharacterized membrane protein
MRDVLLTIHILAAAAWIGGGLYGTFALRRHTANEGPRKALAVADALGSKYFGTAFAVLLVSGVGLVLTSDAFGWGSGFVIIGIGVLVVEGALEGAVLGPATKRLAESDDPVAFNGAPILRWGTLFSYALLVFAVWAMVAKPGI